MSSPLLATPGAVPADAPDASVAAHYGDPFAEQRALVRGWGVVDRSHRGVLRITGTDRRSWLHSLTTQHLEQLPAGAAAEALVLSPQGRVEHHLTLTDDGAAIWLHVEPGEAASLLEFLESMRFMLRVEPRDVSAEYAVLTLLGPGVPAGELVPGAIRLDSAVSGGRRPESPRSAVSGGRPPESPRSAVSGGRPPESPRSFETDLIVPRAELSDVVTRLRGAGAALAGLWAHEALRIAAGLPRLGLDTDDRTIPHEVGWIETAVHLDKGCYRGQETVARVHNLGHPPRRLVLLHLDGSEDRLPARGDAVRLDGAAIGVSGSAARHYELGPIALALVKRTSPVDATLTVDGIAAAQEVVVAPETGASVQIDAALRRRGDVMGRAR